MDPVSCVSCVSWMHWVNAAETHETLHQESGMRYQVSSRADSENESGPLVAAVPPFVPSSQGEGAAAPSLDSLVPLLHISLAGTNKPVGSPATNDLEPERRCTEPRGRRRGSDPPVLLRDPSGPLQPFSRQTGIDSLTDATDTRSADRWARRREEVRLGMGPTRRAVTRLVCLLLVTQSASFGPVNAAATPGSYPAGEVVADSAPRSPVTEEPAPLAVQTTFDNFNRTVAAGWG
jgi:hypothetical protein